MTPTLGRGANLAMRDAALLGRQLKTVAEGEKPLAEALGIYEAELLRYGFEVVRESVAMGQKRMGQNPLP
jgi:2-polyprenyl-6-methoxyphenol hydroxylase-like FAD-dependent oxidoreductase